MGADARAAAPTIYDVAEVAGVSTKTVSRVVNGAPAVSIGMRQRVEHAIRLLDYRPNISARTLAGARSYLLGMILSAPVEGYNMQVQRGASRKCREHGYHLVVEQVDVAAEAASEVVGKLVQTIRLDGVILSGLVGERADVIDLLAEQEIPTVAIVPSPNSRAGASVHIDERRAARDMTDHLLDLGRRRIGFIKGDPAHSGSALRFEGFQDAMRARGAELNPAWIATGDFSYRSGCVGGADLLTRAPDLEAIFASNDEMAFGVMTEAAARNVSIPNALSVAGFDDTAFAAMARPQLTTVRQPAGEMAAVAAEMLMAAPPAPSRRRVVVAEHTLVLRGSTAPLPRLDRGAPRGRPRAARPTAAPPRRPDTSSADGPSR